MTVLCGPKVPCLLRLCSMQGVVWDLSENIPFIFPIFLHMRKRLRNWVIRLPNGKPGCKPRSFWCHSSTLDTVYSEGPGVIGSVPCVQNAMFSGLVTVNLNCVGGTLVSWKAVRVFWALVQQCWRREECAVSIIPWCMWEQLADPERTRGLEQSGPSPCGVTHPNLCTKDFPL